MTDIWEERQRALRTDLLKLKVASRDLSIDDWVNRALGIIEREKVRELERYKERLLVQGQCERKGTRL
jgi:hypothetical protein